MVDTFMLDIEAGTVSFIFKDSVLQVVLLKNITSFINISSRIK